MEASITWIDDSNRKAASEICGSRLPELLKNQKKLEQVRVSAKFVDGTIIGTGEADFTKGVVEYEFTHKDRTFQLIDVPGIEGHESKYEHLVEQSVAKAHLIFYVNGTNKKPEVKTAEKIKRYLNRNTIVYAICNIRGKADAYEFEEDRIDLEETHKGAVEAKSQTSEVLSNILGKELLLGVESIQGLLGFCSVAFTHNNVSTISRTRTRDLIKAQKSYYYDFGNKNKMRSFSKIDKLVNLITKKLDTFKEDIVESNERKIASLIDDNLCVLQNHLTEHKKITNDIKVEFDSFINSVKKMIQFFSNSIGNKRNLVMNSFFTNIGDSTYEIIEKYSKDKDQIVLKVNEAIEEEKKAFIFKLEEVHQAEISSLTENINSESKRLEEDIKRVKFQNELNKISMRGISLKSAIVAIEFDMKEIGGIILNIGSYTLTGVALGSFGGPIGSIIGGIAGAIVGALSSFFHYIFGGKEKKIRKAQTKARDEIENARSDFKVAFQIETQNLLLDIRKNINESIFDKLTAEYLKMCDVSTVIRSQIESITEFKEKIRRQPHGSI